MNFENVIFRIKNEFYKTKVTNLITKCFLNDENFIK